MKVATPDFEKIYSDFIICYHSFQYACKGGVYFGDGQLYALMADSVFIILVSVSAFCVT